MTIANTTAHLRRTLGALVIAATAAAAVMPAPALAREGLEHRETSFAVRETAELRAKTKYVMKCAYIGSKHKRYKPSHVRIKTYKTKVNCNQKHKGKVIVRSFNADKSDKVIKKSVAEQANRL